MDIQKQIEDQIDQIRTDQDSNFIDSLGTHLERAQLYYEKGISEDEQFFNDVIYRVNQAYEGALKEAYKILGGKSEKKAFRETPNNIEDYFKSNNIFKDRVLQLFENYRKEWRNKSTHDYKLVFDEDEAFIALTSVSSFVHLLLKQIQEKIAYNKEQEKLESKKKVEEQLNEILADKSLDLSSKTLKLIEKFAEGNELLHHEMHLSEANLMGMIHGFFSKAGTELQITRSPLINSKEGKLRLDFLLEYQDEKVILEVKKYLREGSKKQGIEQVLHFLVNSGIRSGILYFTSTSVREPEMKTQKVIKNIEGIDYTVHIVRT